MRPKFPYFSLLCALSVPLAATTVLRDAAFGQEYELPRVTTKTKIPNQLILAGQSVEVTVEVYGATKAQPDPIPAAIVFALDYSASMSYSIGTLQAATSHIIARLGARDRVAAVAFASDVTLLSQPTSQFANVTSAINRHPVGGSTDLAGGFLAATEQLRNAPPIRLRFGILFTDGHPAPPNTVTQQTQDISDELKSLRMDPFTFHTVGLGYTDTRLLEMIAQRTGGTYVPVTKATDILPAFERIYLANSRTFTTKAVRITEDLAPELRVEHGSFRSSHLPRSLDQDSYDDEMRDKVQSFYRTSEITFPTFSELTSDNYFSYTFNVSVNECHETRDVTIPLRDPQSSIAFWNGDTDIQRVSFDYATITIGQCRVDVAKEWNEANRKLVITLHNSLGRPIRNVVVSDHICDHFHVDWDRFGEGDWVPTHHDSVNGIVEWNLGTVAHPQRIEISFPIRADASVGPGENLIQCGDHDVSWHMDLAAFRVLDSEVLWADFRRDLQALGPLRPAVLGHVSQKLSPSLNSPRATVRLASDEMVRQGYRWRIDVDGLESDSIPTSGAVMGVGITRPTGVLYVKEVDNGYEIVAEVLHRRPLPKRLTTLKFVPRS